MVITVSQHTLSDSPLLSIFHLTIVGAALEKLLVWCVSTSQLRADHGVCALDRRQALVDDLVTDLTLVRDTGQFWQGAIPRVANFLSSIDVLNVSRVLQVRGRALVSIWRTLLLHSVVLLLGATISTYPLSVVGEPIAALVLVDFSLGISTVSGPNRSSTAVVLTIDQSHSRNGVLVVVWILVTTLYQLLLRLFKSKGSNKALAIAWDVYVSHVAGVVHSGLPLQVVAALILVASLVHTCNLHGILVVALIDCLWLAMAVQVVLASNRIQRFFGWRDDFASRHYEIVFWCIFVQAPAPIYLLERRNTTTAAMLVSLGMFIVTDWDLAHQRVVITMIRSSRWCFICDLITLFIFWITVLKRSNLGLLRFSHLNDIIFLKLFCLIFIDGLCRFSTNIREHATLFVFRANGRYLLVDLCIGSILNLTLCGTARSLLRCSLSLDT